MIFVLEKCGNRPVTELNRKNFRNLMLWLTDELNVSNARANRLMSCCRSLLSYLEEDDDYDYDVNQAAKVKGLERDSVRDIVFLKERDATHENSCTQRAESESARSARAGHLRHAELCRAGDIYPSGRTGAGL